MSQSDKLGTYEVIRQIAVGAMAELYLARTVGMEGLEKLVCVKRILPQYIDNASFVNVFLIEARLAATLHHANVVQIFDVGHEDGECFVAMEYVHGEDLGRLVATARDSGVPISLDCALTIASGLCAGLHHAHEKASADGKPLGVVHRDVSPTNVLVSYDGAVKLVDFGIARAIGEPMASGNGMKGKIAYMSPEQCRGKAVLDRRSDVFSIGTILYELTTGRRPFVDATEYGVLQQIMSRDAEPPSKLVPGYPAALEAIVMRALSRDVARRLSTALELQNQLEDFAHDNRLRVSPLVLARLMSTLFPARLEEWDHARAQGAFFVEQHVVRTLIESGKTPSAAPHYVPQPLPPVGDEQSGAAHAAAPTVPAGRGSAPGIAPQIAPPGAATQIGPPPVAPTRLSTPPPGELGRLSTPPPGELGRNSSPMPVATAVSQPRLPTPPPVPGVQPLPGVRYSMPVPNMPGAVPILTPMMAPSGGTLVSSALQAGTLPPSSNSGAMPAGALPGAPIPTGAMSGSGTPGPAMSGPGMPGAGMPGAGMPGAGMPRAGMPGAGMSGAGMPGAGMPGAGMPGAGMPGAGMPGAGMPGAGMPGAGMPGAGMPGAGMPGAGMPGVGMQNASTAGAAVPGAPVRMTPPGYVPAAAGDFGPGETARRAAVAYGSYVPSSAMGDPGQVGGDPAYAAHAAGEPVATRRRSADARPTLIVRIDRRRWVPITAVAVVGVAGVIAVMLALGGGSGSTATSADPGTAPAAAMPSREATPATDPPTDPAKAASAGAPSAAEPGKSAPPAAGAENPGGDVAKPTEAATAATAGAAAGAATTAGTPSSAATAETSGAAGGAPSGAATVGTSSAAGAGASGAAGGAPSGAATARASGAAGGAPSGAATARASGAAGGAPSGAATARASGAAGGAPPGAATAETAGAAAAGTSSSAGAASPAAPGATAANAAGLLPATSETKKRSAKLVPQDSRKPPRPRIRPDAKRVDPKRASKPEAKEQPWNDDSPFMPVQTPKR